MDARKKKVLTVLAVGSLILLWRGYALIAKYLPSEASAESLVTAVDFSSVGPQEEAGDSADELSGVWAEQQSVTEQAWGRDPFADVAGAAVDEHPGQVEVVIGNEPPKGPTLAFTGVSKSNERWLAVVSDRIVGVGAVIDGGYEVIQITKHSITLVRGRWAFDYELGSQKAVVRAWSEER